jgi:tetratricopeptide (TPR) repeat protein
VVKTPFAMMLLVCLCAAQSRAESDAEREARALFKEGNHQMDLADYAGALERYQSAYARFRNVKILLNLGTALRHLGRNVEAAEAYERYLAQPDRDPARSEEVATILVQLDADLGTVRIEAPEAGSTVLLDGRRLGMSPLHIDMHVEPGAHTVAVESDRSPPRVKTVSVARGEKLILPVSPPAPAQETPRAPEARPRAPAAAHLDRPASPSWIDRSPGRAKRIAGFTLLGGGLAVAGAGIACALLARSVAEPWTHGGDFAWDESASGRLATYQALEYASLAVGAAAIAAGVALVTLGARERGAARAFVLPAAVGRGGATLQLQF